jgi:hypothetical protein
LNIGGMDDGLHQQALRIDEDMALFTFDFLARVEAARVDTAPRAVQRSKLVA